ncbi:hypothetical protein [Streptomyces malaysiensis]|uniref:hypothetical protein n=1 Tax=Streptomyces malaysiensis TaxID=92644 RepID=UPI003720BF61
MTDQSIQSTGNERQIPTWIHISGPGWTSLLNQLHHDLLALAPDYQLDGLTTKFGALQIELADRFDEAGEYDGVFTDTASALIYAAEVVSSAPARRAASPAAPASGAPSTRPGSSPSARRTAAAHSLRLLGPNGASRPCRLVLYVRHTPFA